MLRAKCFSKSTQNFIEKSLKKLTLARISLFHKLLIKVVIYSLVYNSFYQKGSLFAYWSNISTFLTVGERSRFRCFFCTYCDSLQNKITFFKKVSWNFTRRRFFKVQIIYDSFYGPCFYGPWLNKNSLLILILLFIVFTPCWKV